MAFSVAEARASARSPPSPLRPLVRPHRVAENYGALCLERKRCLGERP
jgi:hypothetical protein